jgi:hypothetical protein
LLEANPRADGGVELWLADVSGAGAFDWPVPRLARFDHAGTSVLLDWAFTGDGAVGDDIANLIVDSCADGLMDAALLPGITASAADRYLAGLRDGGWSGSGDAVRSAIAACGAAKYSWLGPACLASAVRDELGPSSYGQDTSAVARMRRLAGVASLISEWAAATLG